MASLIFGADVMTACDSGRIVAARTLQVLGQPTKCTIYRIESEKQSENLYADHELDRLMINFINEFHSLKLK